MSEILTQAKCTFAFGTTTPFPTIFWEYKISFTAFTRSDGLWSFRPLCAPGRSVDANNLGGRQYLIWQSYNDQTNQWFHLKAIGGGYFNVMNEGGKALDVAGADDYGSAIVTWDLHNGDNQKFKCVRVN